jgi:ABC-type phosphate transport system substrate-binding protein
MRKLTVVLLICASVNFTLLTPLALAGEGIAVIVNVANPIDSIKAEELQNYFFKRKREWADGTAGRFVDRGDSPERKIFLEKVLRKTEAGVDLYWIGQKLETGNSAPVQSASTDMSIQFVAAFKGAIGYISGSVVVHNKSVKLIRLDE